MDTEVKTKTGAANFLTHANVHLFETELDYNRRKAQYLLSALSDCLIAEATVEAWMEDLGTNGCQL